MVPYYLGKARWVTCYIKSTWQCPNLSFSAHHQIGLSVTNVGTGPNLMRWPLP